MPNTQDLDYLGYLGYLALQGSLDRLVRLVPGIGGIRRSCIPGVMLVGNVSTEIQPITPLQRKPVAIEENMGNILHSKPIYRGKVTSGVGFSSSFVPKEGVFVNRGMLGEGK